MVFCFCSGDYASLYRLLELNRRNPQKIISEDGLHLWIEIHLHLHDNKTNSIPLMKPCNRLRSVPRVEVVQLRIAW